MKKRQLWGRGFRRNSSSQAGIRRSRVLRVICDLIKNVSPCCGQNFTAVDMYETLFTICGRKLINSAVWGETIHHTLLGESGKQFLVYRTQNMSGEWRKWRMVYTSVFTSRYEQPSSGRGKKGLCIIRTNRQTITRKKSWHLLIVCCKAVDGRGKKYIHRVVFLLGALGKLLLVIKANCEWWVVFDDSVIVSLFPLRRGGRGGGGG